MEFLELLKHRADGSGRRMTAETPMGACIDD
jgi:hypothetical protein